MPTQDQEFNGKTILIVNTGSSKKKFIFAKLKKMGIRLICLHREKNWAKPYVYEWIVAETSNHRESLKNVRSFLSLHPEIVIDGVLTFWEDNVVLTAKLAEDLKLPGIPVRIAQKVKNKALFRTFCTQQNLPTPKFFPIISAQDIDKATQYLKFPIVLKPSFGASSVFVVKVGSKSELESTYEYIINIIKNHPEAQEWDDFTLLAEEYIDGHEVDIDMLLQNGKVKFASISDNDQTAEPFFIETAQSIPSDLPEQDQMSLIHMAEETLEKLGIQNGCIHFEAKSTKSGPVPIEINLRMGGDEVYSFVKGAWGVDLIEYAVKIALGIFFPKINKPALPLKYITGKYFLSNHSGIVTKLDVLPQVSPTHHRWLEEIHVQKKIGDPILVPPEGYEYLGWITVSGRNGLDAKKNLRDLEKNINYEVSNFRLHSSLGRTAYNSGLAFAAINKDMVIRSAKLQKVRKTSFQNQRSLRIGVIGTLESDKPSHFSAGQEVQQALKQLGYRVKFFEAINISKMLQEIRKSDIDCIFNTCDRIHNSRLLEPHSAALFDILRIPYTGSNALTLSLCKDKIQVKRLLNFHNIPTPKWDYIYKYRDTIRHDLKFPLIVKPALTDDSMGISNNSVVTTKAELQKQIEWLYEELRMPILIEEYIAGDEYDISILGNDEKDIRVLPLTRSIFTDLPDEYWHIYPFEAKNDINPVYEKIRVEQPPKKISKKLLTLLTEIGVDTYNALNCFDYGKVEIRVDAKDNPYVLELNPNPTLGKNDLFASAAQGMKMDYPELLEEILYLSLERQKTQSSVLL